MCAQGRISWEIAQKASEKPRLSTRVQARETQLMAFFSFFPPPLSKGSAQRVNGEHKYRKKTTRTKDEEITRASAEIMSKQRVHWRVCASLERRNASSQPAANCVSWFINYLRHNKERIRVPLLGCWMCRKINIRVFYMCVCCEWVSWCCSRRHQSPIQQR